MITLGIAACITVVALAWLAGRKADYHHGKADAFREVAEDFTGLARCTWWSNKRQQEAERKQLWLSLCLCDPRVCDALEWALAEARDRHRGLK